MSTVLFLEDEEVSAFCTRSIMEDEGHCVVHVNDTDKAFEYIQANIPDIFISDWRVPGEKSVEAVAREIRKKNASVKIFFTTGYPATEIEKVIGDLSPYSVFQKPLDFDKLLKAIQ